MSQQGPVQAVESVLDKQNANTQVEKQAFDARQAEKFDIAMQHAKTTAQPVAAVPDVVKAVDIIPQQSSLMDVAKQQYQNNNPNASATFSSIQDSSQQISSRIDAIKEALNQPDATLKQAYQGLLEDKLTHIDENLKIALNKAGLEYVPDASTAGIPSALERFLGFLTRSQKHIDSIGSQVANLKQADGAINLADLLTVQVKVNYVQQEMELFTNLLNKGLESTKTLMNTQV